MDACLLCGARAIINRQENSSRTIYNCQNCGVYVVSDPEEKRVERNGAKIAAYFMRRKLKNENDAVLISYQNAKLDKEYLQLTSEQIISFFPKTFAEQMDMALLNLGLKSRFHGDAVKLADINTAALLYVTDKSETALFYMLRALKDEGLVTYDQIKLPCGVVVTPKGHERIAGLRGGGERGVLYLCAAESDSAVPLQNIAQKLAAGLGLSLRLFSSARADMKVGNELVAGIKSARVVICDFTEHAGGAYYAAAMAEALGKVCVASCHASAKDGVGIDSAQLPVVFWKDEDKAFTDILHAIKAKM